MPHVASPSQLLAADIRTGLRQLGLTGIMITCAGAGHRLSFDGKSLGADAHDKAAEAVLAAVGGASPTCLAVVDRLCEATSQDLWMTLTDPATDILGAIPPADLRLFLARALHEEFAGAALAVRDSVGKLGLAVLGAGAIDRFADKFRTSRELPRWDPGPGSWSDRELVVLARSMRSSPGDPVPHLERIPTDPLARRAVAKYASALLDDTRVHTTEELRTRLAPTYHNVRALTALLVSEGFLERDHRRSGRAAPRRPSRR